MNILIISIFFLFQLNLCYGGRCMDNAKAILNSSKNKNSVAYQQDTEDAMRKIAKEYLEGKRNPRDLIKKAVKNHELDQLILGGDKYGVILLGREHVTQTTTDLDIMIREMEKYEQEFPGTLSMPLEEALITLTRQYEGISPVAEVYRLLSEYAKENGPNFSLVVDFSKISKTLESAILQHYPALAVDNTKNYFKIKTIESLKFQSQLAAEKGQRFFFPKNPPSLKPRDPSLPIAYAEIDLKQRKNIAAETSDGIRQPQQLLQKALDSNELVELMIGGEKYGVMYFDHMVYSNITTDIRYVLDAMVDYELEHPGAINNQLPKALSTLAGRYDGLGPLADFFYALGSIYNLEDEVKRKLLKINIGPIIEKMQSTIIKNRKLLEDDYSGSALDWGMWDYLQRISKMAEEKGLPAFFPKSVQNKKIKLYDGVTSAYLIDLDAWNKALFAHRDPEDVIKGAIESSEIEKLLIGYTEYCIVGYYSATKVRTTTDYNQLFKQLIAYDLKHPGFFKRQLIPALMNLSKRYDGIGPVAEIYFHLSVLYKTLERNQAQMMLTDLTPIALNLQNTILQNLEKLKLDYSGNGFEIGVYNWIKNLSDLSRQNGVPNFIPIPKTSLSPQNK